MSKRVIPTTFTDGSYGEIAEGAWIQPVRRNYIMSCCDCGLRHRLDFRMYRGRVQFRAWRMKALGQAKEA